MAEGENKTILYYVHDPMCSWCWGLQSTWGQLQESLPAKVEVRKLLGGLAADSDEPMPEALQQTLQAIWRRIEEQVPHARFNFDFWQKCQPRRSTHIACRAVIAARKQDVSLEEPMILAIQLAYYQQAMNPSNRDVLVSLAGDIGLDIVRFFHALSDPETQQELASEMLLAQQKGARGFPSLLLEHKGWPTLLDIDYNDVDNMLSQVETLMALD